MDVGIGVAVDPPTPPDLPMPPAPPAPPHTAGSPCDHGSEASGLDVLAAAATLVQLSASAAVRKATSPQPGPSSRVPSTSSSRITPTATSVKRKTIHYSSSDTDS